MQGSAVQIRLAVEPFKNDGDPYCSRIVLSMFTLLIEIHLSSSININNGKYVSICSFRLMMFRCMLYTYVRNRFGETSMLHR